MHSVTLYKHIHVFSNHTRDIYSLTQTKDKNRIITHSSVKTYLQTVYIFTVVKYCSTGHKNHM